jgi:hypothetical protein
MTARTPISGAKITRLIAEKIISKTRLPDIFA